MKPPDEFLRYVPFFLVAVAANDSLGTSKAAAIATAA